MKHQLLKHFKIVSAVLGTAIMVTTNTDPARADRICFESNEFVPTVRAGQRFSLGDGDASYLTGNTAGSRVNIRNGPGTEYSTDGSYGLVGEDVTSLMFGYDSNCETWYKVRFPSSGYEGWVHGNYVEFYNPRGLFN